MSSPKPPPPLLGQMVRVRITQACPAQPGAAPLYYGELDSMQAQTRRVGGVYVLAMQHPTQCFVGRCIAVLNSSRGNLAVVAPPNRRYVVGQIQRALQPVVSLEGYTFYCLYERSCGAVIFWRSATGVRFLLIKNRRSCNWGFPKGHVEDLETPEQTALREVHEETGLQVQILPGFSAQYSYALGQTIQKSVTLFLAESQSDAVQMQEEEIIDYAWVEFRQAMAMLKFENDRITLRRATACLSRLLDEKIGKRR